MTAATWPCGWPKSQNNAFTGSTGVAPIAWTTPGSESYAARLHAGLGLGQALDAAGRATVVLDPHVSGISIATEADKKFKRKRGAAI